MLLCLLAVLNGNIFAQSISDFYPNKFQQFFNWDNAPIFDKVNANDAHLADSLHKVYPDHGIYYIKSSVNFTFQRSLTDTNLVCGKEIKSTQSIVTTDNFTFLDAVSFSDALTVGSMTYEIPKVKSKTAIEYNIVKDSLESVFDSDQKLAYFGIEFPTRGIRPTFEYQTNYLDVKYLCSVYFTDEYPIGEKQIKFAVPNWLKIAITPFNTEGIKHSLIVENDSVHGLTNYIYTAYNLPAFKREKNAPSACRTYPHLLVQFKSFTKTNGQHIRLFENLIDQYAWYHQLCNQVDTSKSTLRPFVKQLVDGLQTDEQRVKAIFYWVHNNIRYIAMENGLMGFKPEPAEQVFKNRYGDCKGMANLLKQMLSIAGFDARLTWLGTNDLPYNYSTPNLAVDNHMICTLYLHGSKYFLDGTESFIAFGDYASRIQGRQVLIENGENYVLDSVPELGPERNLEEKAIDFELVGDDLIGNSRTTLKGEGKTSFLYGYSLLTNKNKHESLIHFCRGGNTNLAFSAIQLPAVLTPDSNLGFNYGIKYANQVTKTSDEKYIHLDLNNDFNYDYVDSNRLSSYEFSHKVLKKTAIAFKIPTGYQVSYMPAPCEIANSHFELKAKYHLEGDSLIYQKEIRINSLFLNKSEFALWNAAVKKFKKCGRESIRLKNN